MYGWTRQICHQCLRNRTCSSPVSRSNLWAGRVSLFLAIVTATSSVFPFPTSASESLVTMFRNFSSPMLSTRTAGALRRPRGGEMQTGKVERQAWKLGKRDRLGRYICIGYFHCGRRTIRALMIELQCHSEKPRRHVPSATVANTFPSARMDHKSCAAW